MTAEAGPPPAAGHPGYRIGMSDPLGVDLSNAWRVAVSAAGGYAAILVYVRLAGLRSFAKISAFDFAMTVAIGSILASVAVTSSASLVDGVIAMGTLFLLQGAVAVGRRRFGLEALVDNRPRVLLAHGRILDDQLAAARLTRADLIEKLRGAGVHRLADVDAVVLETTGDVSVLSGGDPVAPEMVEGVVGSAAFSERGPSPP